MKLLFIFFLILANNIAYSQSNESLNELEKRKVSIVDRIEKLEDSLKLLNRNIANYQTQKILKDTSMAPINTVARTDSYIISEPNVNGVLLITFDVDTKVKVIGYRENHFQVCIDDICGYIFRSSLRKTDEMKELIKKDEVKKNNDRQKLVEAEFNKRLDLKIEEDKIMVQKYGQSNFNKMKERQYWIGMNVEMVMFSLGEPSDINKTVGSWGTHEQWVYNDGLYLYFENGKLTSYQQ